MNKDKEWLKEEVWKQDTVMSKGYIYTDDLMSIINELDEPQKPVIPQFVANWIEKWKREELILRDWSRFNLDDENEYEVAEWLYDNDDDEINILRKFTLIDAIRYGYEVEKEPRWVIEKGGNYIKTYLINSNKVVNIDYEPEKEDSLTFLSREEAGAIALLVGGEVEEVTK